MLVLTDSNAVLEAPTRLAYEDPATRQEITQGIMHLCQLYPDYVERRAVQMAKDQLAKTKNQSWSELSLTDQTSIIENNEAEIVEGHFLKLGKFFISAALGIPAFL